MAYSYSPENYNSINIQDLIELNKLLKIHSNIVLTHPNVILITRGYIANKGYPTNDVCVLIRFNTNDITIPKTWKSLFYPYEIIVIDN